MTRWLNPGLLWLTHEIRILGYDTVINPWNPNQNKIKSLILINQILKPENK